MGIYGVGLGIIIIESSFLSMGISLTSIIMPNITTNV